MRRDLEFRSIPNLVRQAAKNWPSCEAVVGDGQRVTFSELARRCAAVTRAAIAAGIEPGDRIGLWAPNCVEWIVAAAGLQGAGGILVPLNTRYKASEAADVLSRSGAKMLVTAGTFQGTDYPGLLRSGAPETFANLTVVALGDCADDDVVAWEDFLATGVTVTEAEAFQRIASVGPDDISDIMFTSGTTGSPKGVMHTHGQSLRSAGAISASWTFGERDRFLVIPPFFHSFGYKGGWMINLFYGVTTYPQSVFNALEILETIQAERISIIMGPPTLFIDLINHPRLPEFDISSLRVTMVAAASVPAELMQALRGVLGFEVILSAYGLTEAHAQVSTSTPDDDPEDVMNSVGRPLPGTEVIVVDVDGNELPVGRSGEVLVRGFNVMRGYWQDPEATAEVIDRNGWLHTGDVGVFNERGFLKITDRLKDMVIVGGFNVYPAEVERILMTHAAVASAAVVGVAHPRYGEVTAAYVELAPLKCSTSQELIEFARAHMANYKVPRRLTIVDSLPRNASLKVLKNVLRDRAAAEPAEN